MIHQSKKYKKIKNLWRFKAMKKFLAMVFALSFSFTALYATTWGTLSIAKSASIANPAAGVNYSYVIAITCTTGDCTSVVISDTVPTLFSYQGASGSPTFVNGVISWSGGATMITSSAQDFTFWGNIPIYTSSVITNIGEVFRTQGGDAKSTTILAMATSIATNSPNWTATATPTFTQTPNAPQQTQTAVYTLNAQRTLTAAATVQAKQTSIAATKTAAITAQQTPNAVYTATAAASATAAYIATQTAKATGTQVQQTATALALIATQTQVAAHSTATARQTAIQQTATAAAKTTLTAIETRGSPTPTFTLTAANTSTSTKTFTITVTPTSTPDVKLSQTVPTNGSITMSTGPVYVDSIVAFTWTTTSTSLSFYNATSPTGCIAGNLKETAYPSGAVTSPQLISLSSTRYSNGMTMSGTGTGAVVRVNMRKASFWVWW
jgi:hypothetical protein